MIRKTTCRACLGDKLAKVFSFGPTPLANAFLTKAQLDEPELFFPLDVYFCQSCHFLELGHVVAPDILFKHYVYVSSTSPVFIAHFEAYARYIKNRFKLGSRSLVIDIGSNDGILLKPLHKSGVNVLGIEPAKDIARRANNESVRTVAKFFSIPVAHNILARYGKAEVITANNVFAHIDNLDNVVEGVRMLLDRHGVFIIEAPYLVDFLAKNYFDLVYHEHLSYLSVAPLQRLFGRLGMEIFDVQKVSVHGGSIRVFVQKRGDTHRKTTRLDRFLHLEKKMDLASEKTYRAFAKKVLVNKAKLLSLLTRLKTMGKSIAGYGAPAKGNTLLNYFGIGRDYIDYIVDDSRFKQGLFTPGTHIPVVSLGMLSDKKPEYILILAWNFAPSIMKKLEEYHNSGDRFIIPVSRPRVV